MHMDIWVFGGIAYEESIFGEKHRNSVFLQMIRAALEKGEFSGKIKIRPNKIK